MEFFLISFKNKTYDTWIGMITHLASENHYRKFFLHFDTNSTISRSKYE